MKVYELIEDNGDYYNSETSHGLYVTEALATAAIPKVIKEGGVSKWTGEPYVRESDLRVVERDVHES